MSEYLIPAAKSSGYPKGPIMLSNLSAYYAEYSSCPVKKNKPYVTEAGVNSDT